MSGRKTTLAVLLLAGGPTLAADYTPPPAVAAGTVVGVHADAAGCATCAGGGDHKFGRPLAARRNQPPVTITLAPGACFGYFPTQWRKWDEVCPIPYAPTAPTKTMPPPVPYPGYGDLPTPRPVDPKSDAPAKPDDPVKPNPGPNGGARNLPPPPPPVSPRTLPLVPVPVNTHAIPAPPATRTLPPPPPTRQLPPIPPLPGEKVSSR